MEFIHDKTFFSEAKIRNRAEQYGFSDPLPVELFLWDCEITAQLQSESASFILKGGTAVQLHLPAKMQRGSVDVDIVFPFTEQEIGEALSRIQKRLQPVVEFERYNPKRPKKRINLITYIAKTSALLPSENNKPREIKIDFLLENLGLPTVTVSEVETFAVEIRKLKCYSITSLIGDKLLTLAENTVGITESADIPKQLYDISLLTERNALAQKQFSEIVDVIETLTPIEAGYRNLKLSSKDALNDIAKTMEKYSLLDTAGADASIKENITNFQQFYVSTSQRQPWYNWCTRALKIRFLAQTITAILDKQITSKEAAEEHNTTTKTEQTLKLVRGEDADKLKKQLMESADTKIPYYRELKGKPVDRVFWQVVSRKNLKTIQNLVEPKDA
jgi:predicted nucleotidyltransferase component of viral defense system